MYSFNFTSTIKDLYDAEEADATRRTIRRFLRWAVALIGAGAIVTALYAFKSGQATRNAIVWLLLGGYAVYYFVIASFLRRRHICKNNDPTQDISIEFSEDRLKFEVLGRGAYKRQWSELVLYHDAPRGVLLYFEDGTVNWLPNRIFADKGEKTGFVSFLQDRSDKLSGEE